MRICLYTATAHPKIGGQEAVVDALARHFTQMGHRAVVLAQRPRAPLRVRDAELPYPVARHPRFVSTRRFVSFYRLWLERLHTREQFDVIHCHDVYPTGYLAALSKGRMKARIVITSHGGDVKAGNVRIVKPGMRPRFVRAIESADGLISIGNFTIEGYRALSSNLPPIVSIPNGIDLEPYRTAAPRPTRFPLQIEPGQYVLFLGRLAKRKGIDVLIDAMAGVPNGMCVIAGSGDQERPLRSTVAGLGLESRVHFVGRVDGLDKIWLLQNAACVAMPTRGWEAFPLVLIESFAAGQPVIGSDVPGIADLVEPGQTGILTQPERPDALVEAIRSVMADPSRARAMGARARDIAQRYSWKTVAARHIELYEQLCGSRKSSEMGAAGSALNP